MIIGALTAINTLRQYTQNPWILYYLKTSGALFLATLRSTVVTFGAHAAASGTGVLASFFTATPIAKHRRLHVRQTSVSAVHTVT